MSFTFKAIAKNPPAIFIVAGVFIYVIGLSMGNQDAMNVGILCFILGFILQVLYLGCVRRGF